LAEIINVAFAVGLIAGTIKFAVPLLLAALGEVVSQRSGVINLGLEGVMLVGAFVGFITALFTGNIWIGFLMGALSGGLMSILLPIISETLHANQIVTGIGIWILGSGLTFLLFRLLFEGSFVPSIPGLANVDIPVLSDVPHLGRILFQHDILVYLTFALVPVFYYFLFHTRIGLNIRSIGENPKVAETLGLDPVKYRYYCVILGGGLAGLGGAYITLEYARKFTEDITAGIGFVAVAIVILGRWNPVGVLFGALLFAGAISLQLRMQSIGLEIAPQFFLMLPYLLTIIALIIASRTKTGPEALGAPYIKEK
jgi:ABC-type uncharacterized transport system permease subunit